MLQRCYNPNVDSWPYYGGRGIAVCERWRQSFENFIEDMGEKPARLSLDRRDVNGEYCRDNCRWVSHVAQMNNTRANHMVDLGSRRLTLAEISLESGLPHWVISRRLRAGWPVERAVSSPQSEGCRPLEH